MAFSYESLKKLTTAAIVDGEVHSADIGTGEITADKISSGAVTSGKLATNAVSLSSTVVTGTNPIRKGGTGTTSFSGTNYALTSSGSALTTRQHGISSMSVYTSNNTWSRPSNVKYIKVQVVGGGGGGSGHGESGGSGGYA